MATRYPSIGSRKQAFKRGEARDAEARRAVASWPDGLPPVEPEREITYAADLLPDLPGRVHGLVAQDPVWVVQCDGCGRVAVGELNNRGERSTLVIQFCGNHFGHSSEDPRRLCARCRVDAGWNDYDTVQCRENSKTLEFHEAYMQEREPTLFGELGGF